MMTMHADYSARPATRRPRAARPAPEAPATASAAHTPLVPIADQAQQWITHGQEPIAFEAAVARVLEAREADGRRADQVADLRAWGFGSSDGRTMQLVQTVGRDFGAHPEPLTLRKMAFGQLCARAGVPAGYVATLPPMLQIACLNWGMAHMQDAQPALLRSAGGTVRAIVSDRYAAFDDDLLLELVDEALRVSGYRADAMVRATVIGPHTALRITIPGEGVAVRQGDVIEWGIDLGNSELGLRSVQVVPATYRLICTNGMRNWTQDASARIRHVGDATKIREDLRAVIPTAFAAARGDLDLWRASVDDLITDALDDIESLRGFGLTSGEQRQIGRTLLALPEDTANDEVAKALRLHRTTTYDVANAITETARDRSDVASRMSLEETAHRYLERKVG